MADNTAKPKESSDRRTFLKIGAGIVGGAVVVGVASAAYYDGVIGSNNRDSSSTVASLQNELSTTQSQLTDTQVSLNNATSTISTLSSQLSQTQSSLSNAQSSLSAANAQNSTLSSQLSSTQSALTSANGQISTLQSQVTSASSAASSAQSQAAALGVRLDTVTGFLTLSSTEQSFLTAVADTIIPTDSNGPGATTAGVAYFMDRQLATDYGKSAHMYTLGPFVPPNQTESITVTDLAGNSVTYSGGSNNVSLDSGMEYQYSLPFREFFRYGIQASEAYCNTAYGGDFESLSAANQVHALTDIYNNKPTSFNGIIPQDFFYELFVMTWAGFTTDPLYGGNQNMIGWSFSGFNGTNQGDFYGEGHTAQQLMVASVATSLKPASLAQFQKGSP